MADVCFCAREVGFRIHWDGRKLDEGNFMRHACNMEGLRVGEKDWRLFGLWRSLRELREVVNH